MQLLPCRRTRLQVDLGDRAESRFIAAQRRLAVMTSSLSCFSLPSSGVPECHRPGGGRQPALHQIPFKRGAGDREQCHRPRLADLVDQVQPAGWNSAARLRKFGFELHERRPIPMVCAAVATEISSVSWQTCCT